ncbi:MAG: chemotaxis protein CheA [Desulfobacteraceae bacterium]|nr:chemotaxis protein CheA [Desulfobacteraceae bacterium]
MDQHKQAYREEAQELLSELETSLMELENKPEDMDLVGRVFRAMHTIKGSGAMFGFDQVAEFTHEIESAYDGVRQGLIPVTRNLVDLTLYSCDQIKKMIREEPVDPAVNQNLVLEFQKILGREQENQEGNPLPVYNKVEPTSVETPEKCFSGDSAGKDSLKTYRIRFRPGPDIFASGSNPLTLIRELTSMGPHHLTTHTGSLPCLKHMNPETSYLFWDIVLTTSRDINAIKDIFIFVEDLCELNIDIIADPDAVEGADDYMRLGEILMARGDLSPEDLQNALSNQKKIGELLVEKQAVDKDIINSALAEQKWIKESRQISTTPVSSSIRVAADKLDTLVDLVGELVTVQARLSQKASSKSDPEWSAISEAMERLTAKLRDNTMGIRMMPIGTTFSKFKRLVRDLSRELKKDIALFTDGGETELDKNVIERLNDPLVHILRNCMDHGIEAPHVRKQLGKNPQGKITLSATHSGAHVLIRISDDGKGLDPEWIRAKAAKKGLISPETELSENEVFSLLFAPGFSTAEKITDISGRGVGLDVVKKSIEGLKGSIELVSKKGSGTTLLMKLPLTLAIIDGLLVQIGQSHFVLPLSSIEECVELTGKETLKNKNRHILKVRNEMVPYVPLRTLFGINGSKPEIEQIVIVEKDHARMGFVVDQVIGKHQTVIKNLGRIYRNTKGFSGATILPDGKVALILDINGLLEIAETEEFKSF